MQDTGSGIGMATALLAAEQGYQVAAWDISEQGILKTKELAGDLASSIHPIICDVANAKAVAQAMVQTVAIGKPHMLVNNAGPVAIGRTTEFMDMVNAAFSMIHHVTTAFLETKPEKGASIVNIASVVGPLFGGGESWTGKVIHASLTDFELAAIGTLLQKPASLVSRRILQSSSRVGFV